MELSGDNLVPAPGTATPSAGLGCRHIGAATLEWAGRGGHDIMTVGHPHPPEKVRPGVEAWKKALIESGIDPKERRCQFHVRTHVNENGERARETAMAAVTRYDAISRIARKSSMVETENYDWEGNVWRLAGISLAIPTSASRSFTTRMRHYYFDTLTTTFKFWRDIPRRNQESYAPVRQRSHARLSLRTVSGSFAVA